MNGDTSIGQRIQAYDYTLQLFKRHPWLGNGTGSYPHLMNKENPISGHQAIEPHNEYCLIASEFGMVGLTLLFIFFSTLLWTSYRLQKMRSIAIAIMLSFMIGNLSESLLYFPSTGYFFMCMMALCLGEIIQ